jgi:ADP-ribose pyrophosphatase YjhB (NUDIX family)
VRLNKSYMYSTHQWLQVAQKLQSIAQAGLAYSVDKYDLERFKQIMEVAKDIINKYSMMPMEKIDEIFDLEEGYLTPKVDVRGVIFRNDKVLLVRESADGKWALPGGWADNGFTPSEVVEKEVEEESGLQVKATRLLAVFDKKCHAHPPDLYYVYKLFFLCRESGGVLAHGMETSDVRFFDIHELPELSTGRNTKTQIQAMFELRDKPGSTLFD